MLPQLPRALDPDYLSNIQANLSGNELAMASAPAETVDHHCQICPTCSHKLTGHHCKLVCTECGYYLSCADYY